MRRLSVLSMVLGLLLALPGGVAAAPPDRFSDDTLFVVCDQLSAPDGRTVFAIVEISQEFGSFGTVAIWASGADPFFDDPIAVSADATAAVSADGTDLSASFELWTFDPLADPPLGDPLGTAVMNAELAPLGDPIVVDDKIKEGNRLIRQTGTRQALSVSGQLVLPDATAVDLTDCFGEHQVITFFGTNPARAPASTIFRSDSIQLECHWATDETFVDLFAFADDFGGFSDVFVSVGESFVFGFNEAVLTSSSYSATFELMTEFGDVVGSAEATASLSPTGERVRFMDRFGNETVKFNGEVLSVDGTLDIALDGGLALPMDDASCAAMEGRNTFHLVDPRGPKARPLANDTPEAAEPIAIGGSDRVITGGNALEPEAPCVAGTDPETGEEFEVPMGYTAWWSFTGTGEDVTISTAGSDFDTVLAVYLLDGETLVQVACVDDVVEPEFSLQAEATIATDAGATYLIQAGGFGGSAGRLLISVE